MEKREHSQQWELQTIAPLGAQQLCDRGRCGAVRGLCRYLSKYSSDSIYMNDLWIFNSRSMQWAEVKTSGDIPSHRSNCSLNYDPINNKIIMFGGGGSNKTRFNSINLLDWNTKVWTEITPKGTSYYILENETAPW